MARIAAHEMSTNIRTSAGSLGASSTTSTMTPREYATFVEMSSSRTVADSLYPGTNLRNLASYLKQPYEHVVQPSNISPESQAGGDSFVILHEFRKGARHSIARFKTPKDLQDVTLETDGSIIDGRLLFMRGNMSPTWLNYVGSKFKVDPNFFQRHMDSRYAKEQSIHSMLSSPPSGAVHQSRFRLVTIGSRMVKKTPQQTDLQKLRTRADESWDNYIERLKRGRTPDVRHGDSVVRDFLIYDHEHFGFEQDISVLMTNAAGSSLVIIWLDVGRDLAESLAGPWSHDFFKVNPMEIDYYPTIQDTSQFIFDESLTYNTKERNHAQAEIMQSASRLHTDFDKGGHFLGVREPVRALLHSMRLSSASILQHLNMVKNKINLELQYGTTDDNNEHRLTNLLYHKQKLDNHIHRLVENKIFISHHIDEIQPPTPLVETRQARPNLIAEPIIQEFEQLQAMARDLSAECDRGIGILMNRTMVRESQKAIEQAEGVAKLTRLAFFYIPLSFTGTLFGMNFTEFTSGANLSIWVWFVVSVPILVISLLFMVIDLRALISGFHRSRAQRRQGKHSELDWSNSRTDFAKSNDV